MDLNEKSKRKTWTKKEVLGLLKCYLARKDEFQHSRKKINAYANVLEDMIFQGFTDAKTTVSGIEGKMKTLLVAYKAAKDNANQTGATPTILPYMKEMDEIFGDKFSRIPTPRNPTPRKPTPRKTQKKRNPKKTEFMLAMLNAKKDAAAAKRKLQISLFEKLQKTLDDNLKDQQEILKNAENKKMQLLEQYLNKKIQLLEQYLNKNTKK